MGEKNLLNLGIWKLDLQNEGPVYGASGQGGRVVITAAWRAPSCPIDLILVGRAFEEWTQLSEHPEDPRADADREQEWVAGLRRERRGAGWVWVKTDCPHFQKWLLHVSAWSEMNCCLGLKESFHSGQVTQDDPGDRWQTPRHLSPCVYSAVSPYYRTKLRGLYTTAKADAEAECKWVLSLCFAVASLLTQVLGCRSPRPQPAPPPRAKQILTPSLSCRAQLL